MPVIYLPIIFYLYVENIPVSPVITDWYQGGLRKIY